VSGSLVATNSELTSVSSSLIATNSELTSVSSSLIATNSELASVSSSLVVTTATANTAYTLSTNISDVINETEYDRLGLDLTGTIWGGTTPPAPETLVEGYKTDWTNGDVPVIRNPNREGLALNGVLADPDGYLQIKLKNDYSGGSGIEDAIIFLPYYSSSYTS